MKLLIIDNYDSFTFNLVQYLGCYSDEVIVKRNDRVDLGEIKQIAPDKIVISPGPGRPEDSGISLPVIQELGKTIPILGVCLGHQGIGLCFGARIVHAPQLMHGKVSTVCHSGDGIYKDIPQNFQAARYHSLVIDRRTLNSEFEITAETTDGLVMGIRHRHYPMEGVQFHPESVLTENGDKLLNNWVTS